MRAAALRIVLVTLTVVLATSLRPSQPALAVVHLAEIHELMVGFDGDPDVQFVEINMRLTGQNITVNTKLATFDASGTFIDADPGTGGDQPLLVVSGNVPNAGDGVRWIMGTTAFETASGIQTDFEFPANPGLPTTAGMVCLFEDLRDFTNPVESVDCVAYGGASFTGQNPNSSPSEAATVGPGDGGSSLTRFVPATFGASPPWAQSDDAVDFFLACPTPENNAGQVGSLECPVGGIAEFADVDGAPLDAADSSGTGYAVVAGASAAVVVGVIVLVGGSVWYVRRRFSRS
jgi:hypothetical protein